MTTNNGFPLVQINYSVRESQNQILESTTLINLRSDSVDQCVNLLDSIKERLNYGGEKSENKPDKIVVEMLKENQKSCPECGEKMILRTSKNGKHPGSRFFGCSRYPVCGATLPA